MFQGFRMNWGLFKAFLVMMGLAVLYTNCGNTVSSASGGKSLVGPAENGDQLLGGEDFRDDVAEENRVVDSNPPPIQQPPTPPGTEPPVIPPPPPAPGTDNRNLTASNLFMPVSLANSIFAWGFDTTMVNEDLIRHTRMLGYEADGTLRFSREMPGRPTSLYVDDFPRMNLYYRVVAEGTFSESPIYSSEILVDAPPLVGENLTPIVESLSEPSPGNYMIKVKRPPVSLYSGKLEFSKISIVVKQADGTPVGDPADYSTLSSDNTYAVLNSMNEPLFIQVAVQYLFPAQVGGLIPASVTYLSNDVLLKNPPVVATP